MTDNGSRLHPRLREPEDEDRVAQRVADLEVAARGHRDELFAVHLEDRGGRIHAGAAIELPQRSEEHTSELQSQSNLVCRLLLEKKKMNTASIRYYEDRGLVKPARRGGKRMYAREQLRRLAFIHVMQRLGIRLDAAAAVIDEPSD